MDQQRSQIGHLAANLLFELMEKKPSRSKSILTEPKLVVRDSTNRGGLSERPTAVGDNKRSVKHAARR
jgi:hypothetical protein